MERKTEIHAAEGKQEIVVTRAFDLPLHLLFRAYTEPDIVAQWMGTRVLKLDNQKYGGWQFQTTDPHGNVVFQASGVIHDFVPDRRIVRTFQMENTPFEAQLEFLDFEKLTDHTSKLTMQIIYKSVELRNMQLQLPFAQGINMAHNRLQQVLSQPKY